jgi:hypothetical protein
MKSGRSARSRGVALTAAAFAGWLSAFAAHAGDLVIGAESDIRFDDNVYGSSDREVSDAYWTIAPTFELEQRWQTVTLGVNAWPTYEMFFDESDVDGFNYDADATLRWEPTERASFELSEDFRRHRSLRDLDTAGGVQPGRDYFAQNLAHATFDYRTSPQGRLSLSGWHTLWRFERSNRTDQQSAGTALGYDRAVSERARVGGVVSFSRQILEPEAGSARHTDYFNGSFSFRWSPEKTLNFAASVGPAFVRQPKASVFPASVSRASVIRRNGLGDPRVAIVGTCPTVLGIAFDGPGCIFVDFPSAGLLDLSDLLPVDDSAVPEVERESWTYFADVELTKTWETASLSGTYKRDQGANAALGFTTVADTVALAVTWRPIQRLSLYFNASWENREESTRRAPGSPLVLLDTLPASGPLFLVPVGVLVVPGAAVRDRGTVRYVGTSVGADYYLKPYLKLEAQLGWSDQEASRTSGFGDSDRIWTRIGLDFEYGPLRW